MTRTEDRRRKRKSGKRSGSRQRALEGLHDALGLMLTRVIEDEVSVEEARTMLAYLQKELDSVDPPRGRHHRTPAGGKRKKVDRAVRGRGRT